MRGSHAVYFLLTGMPLPPSNFRVKLKMIVCDVDGGSGGSDDDGDCLIFVVVIIITFGIVFVSSWSTQRTILCQLPCEQGASKPVCSLPSV